MYRDRQDKEVQVLRALSPPTRAPEPPLPALGPACGRVRRVALAEARYSASASSAYRSLSSASAPGSARPSASPQATSAAVPKVSRTSLYKNRWDARSRRISKTDGPALSVTPSLGSNWLLRNSPRPVSRKNPVLKLSGTSTPVISQ